MYIVPVDINDIDNTVACLCLPHMTFCRVENVRHLEPPEQAHILGRLPVGEDDAGEHLHTGQNYKSTNLV